MTGTSARPLFRIGPQAGLLLRRLLMWLVMVWLAYSMVFFMVRIVPGDPVRLMLGEQAASVNLEAMRHRLGLDQSLPVQYVDSLRNFTTGDLGTSLYAGEPVFDLLTERLPYTLTLATLSLLLAVALSFPLGVIAGRRPGSGTDKCATMISSLGLAIPNFWLGPLLILAFSIALGWFPTAWDGSVRAWVLPALTLGTSLSALLTRMIRAEFVRVRGSDYIRTAVAKGLTPFRIDWVHTVRNLLVPVVTVLGLQAGALLAGSVVTENIFSVPGLGQLMLEAINQRDYPVVEGCTLWVALVYLALSIGLDMLYLLVDPRQRKQV